MRVKCNQLNRKKTEDFKKTSHACKKKPLKEKAVLFFDMSKSMTHSPCSTEENEQRRCRHDAATERWLKTIRQTMRKTAVQPRVHFQRMPQRPVDDEGILRDFE